MQCPLCGSKLVYLIIKEPNLPEMFECSECQQSFELRG